MSSDWLAKAVATDGRMSLPDLVFLHGLALVANACCPGLVSIEIGTFRGRSACAIGAACALCGTNLITIDNWKKLPSESPSSAAMVRENITKAGLQHAVDVWTGNSAEVGRNWVGAKASLIFIDGDHAKQGVLDDIGAWWPHLADNGIMAFHDDNAPGVMAALEDFERNYTAHFLAKETLTRAYRKA